MTQPDKSDRDAQVTLPMLVAALIGRTLRKTGFEEVSWRDGEVHARHRAGDKLLIWVQEVE